MKARRQCRIVSFFARCWHLVAGSVLVIIAATTLLLSGHSLAAQLFSLLGTLGVVAATLAHITLFDSKRRWPELTARERWTKIVTFRR